MRLVSKPDLHLSALNLPLTGKIQVPSAMKTRVFKLRLSELVYYFATNRIDLRPTRESSRVQNSWQSLHKCARQPCEGCLEENEAGNEPKPIEI